MTLIREDQHGLYVLVGGYAFRPLEVQVREFFPSDPQYARLASGYHEKPTKLIAGEHVKARHNGGTTTAKVADERWFSSSVDPQYIKHTSR